MSYISKIKRFAKYDFRKKLSSISKKSGIQLYPSLFHKKGIKKFYTKLFFNLIINEKFKKIKKFNYDKIFEKDINETKINFLISLPRSGKTLLRNLLSSYIELFYKIGNGVPKYDGLKDKWISFVSPLIEGDLYNQIQLDEYPNNLKFISNEAYKKNRIIFSRHPVTKSELYDINLARPVIIIRNPKEQIKSFYLTRHFIRHKNNTDIQSYLIDEMITVNYIYYKFWKNFLKNKIKNLVVNFIELQNSTKNIFGKILDFYHYELNQDIISQSVEINSKENYQKYFGAKSNETIRFSKNEMFDVEKINNYFKNNVLLEESIENFNFLNEIN